MPPFRVLAAAAALALCTGCTIADTPAGAGREPAQAPAVTAPAARCAETSSTPANARPPVLAESTSPWLGQGDLWAAVPDYPANANADGSGLVLKFPLVTLANGTPTPALGPPAVSATRVDAPGDATGQVGGFASSFGAGALSFWPASVDLPAAGCWAITGTLGAAVVQFVVDVRGA